MSTTNNLKYEMIGEAMDFYENGKLCGTIVGQELPNSSNPEGLARFYIDSNMANHKLLSSNNDFLKGFSEGICSEMKKYTPEQREKAAPNSIKWRKHSSEYCDNLIKNIPGKELWNIEELSQKSIKLILK